MVECFVGNEDAVGSYPTEGSGGNKIKMKYLWLSLLALICATAFVVVRSVKQSSVQIQSQEQQAPEGCCPDGSCPLPTKD